MKDNFSIDVTLKTTTSYQAEAFNLNKNEIINIKHE